MKKADGSARPSDPTARASCKSLRRLSFERLIYSREFPDAAGPFPPAAPSLKNHGILSAASDLEAAVAFFIRLENLCQTQLLADAAGVSVPLPEEDAADIFAKLGGEDEAWFAAQELFQAIEKECGHEYKL